MTQLAIVDLPTLAPLKSRPAIGDWQGYDATTTEADALTAFLRKYGYAATEIQIWPSCVLVGPIQEGESDE